MSTCVGLHLSLCLGAHTPAGRKAASPKGILGQRHQKDNGLPTKIDSKCGLEGYSQLKDGRFSRSINTVVSITTQCHGPCGETNAGPWDTRHGIRKAWPPPKWGLWGLPDDSFCTFRCPLVYWLFPRVWWIHVDSYPLVILLQSHWSVIAHDIPATEKRNTSQIDGNN